MHDLVAPESQTSTKAAPVTKASPAKRPAGSGTPRAATATAIAGGGERPRPDDDLGRRLAGCVQRRAAESRSSFPLLQRLVDKGDGSAAANAEEKAVVKGAILASTEAGAIAGHLPPKLDSKCVGVGGPPTARYVALSGWAPERAFLLGDDDAVSINSGQGGTAAVIKLTRDHLVTRGYAFRTHGFDGGTPGRYYSSHAERQVSVARSEHPIGVSREMCFDCMPWFRIRARQLDRVLVVADPWEVHLFDREANSWTAPRTADAHGPWTNRFTRDDPAKWRRRRPLAPKPPAAPAPKHAIPKGAAAASSGPVRGPSRLKGKRFEPLPRVVGKPPTTLQLAEIEDLCEQLGLDCIPPTSESEARARIAVLNEAVRELLKLG